MTPVLDNVNPAGNDPVTEKLSELVPPLAVSA
jgi:hypothetical protein